MKDPSSADKASDNHRCFHVARAECAERKGHNSDSKREGNTAQAVGEGAAGRRKEETGDQSGAYQPVWNGACSHIKPRNREHPSVQDGRRRCVKRN